MRRCLSSPASLLAATTSQQAREHDTGHVLCQAQEHVARLIGARPDQIYWTSGATESNNLAIMGTARGTRSPHCHMVSVQTEHPSVLDCFHFLQQSGVQTTLLRPQADGLVPPDTLAATVRPDTVLVSIMHVNNEIGVIQDIAAIGQRLRDSAAGDPLFHVDAAQSAGKLSIDVHRWHIDLLSLSAHKFYGPKGCGALYVSDRAFERLQPLIHGGGEQRGLRSGTLPEHQIAGTGEAARLAREHLREEGQRLEWLQDRLWTGLQSIAETYAHGQGAPRFAGILSVCFPGIDTETFIAAARDIAVSTGSACASAKTTPSHVLKALGVPEQHTHSTIRFSLGRFTTAAQIDHTISVCQSLIPKLRS